jgi:hypothetical protein
MLQIEGDQDNSRDWGRSGKGVLLGSDQGCGGIDSAWGLIEVAVERIRPIAQSPGSFFWPAGDVRGLNRGGCGRPNEVADMNLCN